jgi:predicted metal-dependent hydrolase
VIKDARHASAANNFAGEEIVTSSEFKTLVHSWAVRLDVQPALIRIAPMRTKWASCSAGGRLTFDRGLLAQPADFRREAVVHELLHLKVPNHGPLFRALLRAALAPAPSMAESSGKLPGP